MLFQSKYTTRARRDGNKNGFHMVAGLSSQLFVCDEVRGELGVVVGEEATALGFAKEIFPCDALKQNS